MKKLWLIVIIALFGTLIICGYAVFDNVFPKAGPIKCPTIENITSITLTQNNDVSVTMETADFEEFLQYLSNSQPTRMVTVNDYPTAKPYYYIEVDASERQYWYFVYAENSQVYIEIPYEGIYKANEQFLDFVLEYFKG